MQTSLFPSVILPPVERPVLRPYQSAAIDAIKAAVACGKRRVMVTAPCGAGKMTMIARILSGVDAQSLFVAHRVELINQCAQTLYRFGVTDMGIVRAQDERSNPEARCQVASVQTLQRRKLPGFQPSVICIDENHRSASDSYLALFDRWPDALFVGFTATPIRTDNRGLGEVWDHLVTAVKPSELVRDGHLCTPKIYAAPSMPSLDDVGFVAGDYNQGELGRVMSNGKVLGDIVKEWETHHDGRATVVFAVNVEHSKNIVDRFQAAHVRAEHLDGTTPELERAAILARLETGETQVVSNVDVLTEGWDMPRVKCVILARPTQSLRVYIQAVGRVMRPWQGVEPIILDHAGNVERHGFPNEDRTFDLQKGWSRPVQSVSIHTCKKCFAMWCTDALACPECGHEREVKKREVDEDSGVQLKQLDHTPQNEERNYFVKQAELARAKGFKPGFAGAKFKEKFGKWPPWAWSQQLQATFASDTQWQENKAANEERKAWFAKPVEERAHPGAQDEGADDDFISF